ncbi:hypothetical protein INR49_013298 [Caranx melampygus]|nr:hypothetical protein INR49_013298 [Caranx melampygus]
MLDVCKHWQNISSLLLYLIFPTWFGVFCFQVRKETVKILLSGLLPLLIKRQETVIEGERKRNNLVPTYMCICVSYLEHHHKTVIFIVEPHLLLHFLCFLSLSVSLEGQMQSHYLTKPLETSEPSAFPPLLLGLLSKRWVRCNLSTLDGSLDDAAEPGLVFLGAAQSRLSDGIHVSFMLHIQLDHVLPLFIGALVLLLKFEDVLHCDLGDGCRGRAGRQD